MLPGRRVSRRPRGVRCNSPCWSRYGSTTSSRVSRCSESAAAASDADRAAAVALGDGPEIAPVQAVQAEMVDLELGERTIGDRGVDLGAAGDRGEVAHLAQQTAGDRARRGRAVRSRPRPRGSAERPKSPRRARRSPRARVVVEVQAREMPKRSRKGVVRSPVRGRADQGERRRSIRTERAAGRRSSDRAGTPRAPGRGSPQRPGRDDGSRR